MTIKLKWRSSNEGSGRLILMNISVNYYVPTDCPSVLMVFPNPNPNNNHLNKVLTSKNT